MLQAQLDSPDIRAFFIGLKPDPVLTVSTWADEHRILSNKASAEPGRYRTDRTPYLREIMDRLSVTDPTKEIVFMKGAQVGATECGNNWMGYIIDHAPAPTMLIQPTVDLAKRNSKLRIEPLVEETPRLMAKVKNKRSRDSNNTVLSKDFPGGTLLMTGANSAVGLRSTAARNIFMDEIDAYPGDIDQEGDPIDLARARTRTFFKKKLFYVSTPTIYRMSNVEKIFDNSTQRYYYVPCPHCDYYQKLDWKRIKWENKDPKTAHYECVDCEEKIFNWQKTKMLEQGKWVAENPDADIEGYHLNSLYSPVGWYTWEDAVKEFLEAKNDPKKLKAFINTVLGETWKEQTEVPDWRRLYERREQYKTGLAPSEVCFITAGVDVQKDRLEVEIVGWYRGKGSYSIDYRVIPGDTSSEVPWRALTALMGESFEVSGTNVRLPICVIGIDSGYNTQVVYNYCRRFPQTRVIAVKGDDRLQTLIGHPKPADVTIKGKRIARGLKVWPVGVSVAKVEFYGWLRQPAPVEGDPEPEGFCHFPEYNDEYFKMLTAEELVFTTKKGYTHSEWQKIRDRNEALDCRIYARAAAAVRGMDRFRDEDWSSLQNELTQPEIVAKSEQPKPEAKKPRERKAKSSYWD